MKSKILMLTATIMLLAVVAVPLRLAAQHDQDKPKHHHYKVIDMGTLGGPNSYVNEAAEIVSRRGMFAAGADTSIPDPNYPNSCLFCGGPFITHAFQWRNGVRSDLGALPGVNTSFAQWISDSGITVGYSEDGLIDPLLGIPEVRAVVWKDGRIVDLGTLGGGYESIAFSVNSKGQVAGVSQNLVPDPFFFLGTQDRTFLWQNGVMKDLGTLGGPDAGLLGFEGNVEINERGQVIACSYTATINPATGTPIVDPFLWDHETMIDLGGLGGTAGCAVFLNNRGQVVGYSDLAGDASFHPFLWERGGMTDLGTFGGPTGIAYWINEPGVVVGNADLLGTPGCGNPNIFHGFVWNDGVMTDIGTLAGTDCSTAASINSKNQVVGGSFTIDFSVAAAILWEKGSLVDLNILIPSNSAVHLDKGVDINDRGEIAGFGSLSNGDGRAFLLIPCDENHPGVEGCDYSLADTDTAFPRSSPAVGDLSGRTLLPLRMRPGYRPHFLGHTIGPRN